MQEVLQSDSWFYTGLTKEQYDNAVKEGFIEPVNLGNEIEQHSGIRFGIVISKEEACIDGYIEGYLTRLYGECRFSKILVKIPQGTILHSLIVDDEGHPLSHITTLSIPIANSKHIGDLTASPKLVEEVLIEPIKEEELGTRLSPVEPLSLD